MEKYNGPERRCFNKEMHSLLQRLTAVEIKIESSDKSLNLAREAINTRLEGMNEFRAAIKDYQATTVTRNELDILLKSINSDLREVRDFKLTLEGKASKTSVNIAIILAIISFFTSVIGFLTGTLKFLN